MGSNRHICSGSEVGSHVRLIDFVYHSTLGLRVIKKKKKNRHLRSAESSPRCRAEKEHMGQSGPESGPGFDPVLVKVIQVGSFSLGNGSSSTSLNPKPSTLNPVP